MRCSGPRVPWPGHPGALPPRHRPGSPAPSPARRTYEKVAETTKEWATSPYDTTLAGIRWGGDKGKGALSDAPIPGAFSAMKTRTSH